MKDIPPLALISMIGILGCIIYIGYAAAAPDENRAKRTIMAILVGIAFAVLGLI